MEASYMSDGTPAATDRYFFVAPRICRVQAISQVHATAAGSTSTMSVEKCTGTTAAGSGTILHSGTANLNATANTTQTLTLVSTVATLTMAAGDRLAVKFNHTIQSTAGVLVTVLLNPC